MYIAPKWISLLCIFFVASSAVVARPNRSPIYQDIFLRETNELWIFGNQAIRLEFNKSSGAWQTLAKDTSAARLMSATELSQTIDFVIDTVPMVNAHGAVFIRHMVHLDRMREGVSLDLVYGILPVQDGRDRFEYELTCRYTLLPGVPTIQRSASLLRRSDADAPDFEKMRGFLFKIPNLVIDDAADCVVDVPGPFFPHTFLRPETPLTSLADTSLRFHSAPDAGFGLLALTNKKANTSLAAWMETRGEVAYFPAIRSDGQQITMQFTNDRTYRMPANFSVASDVQHIELGTSLPDVLLAYRQMCERHMPLNEQTPAWVREMVLLEIFPDYFPTGFKGITQKLAFYKAIGFNAIYLMPHWQGGYSPIDFYEINPKYGTANDLKTLVRTAHSLGMKVFFDMVIHGFHEDSPIIWQHPDIFAYDEEGRAARHPTWKSVTTDWASPDYQEYMADLALHHVKTYGIDGYRLDAATYKGPNWDMDLLYPAYRSGSAAPELMERMLAAMRTVKPGAVMLSEVFGPVFYTVSNLAHDNQAEAATVLLEMMEKGAYTARDYKLHMRNVMLALPKGANRVYFSRNHDTSWFFHFGGYTARFLALDAIHSLCAIPEIFAGDPNSAPNPDDDKAIFAYYKRLFSLRRDFPELAKGELLLREIDSSNPRVFTALRHLNGKLVLIMVSLSDAEEEITVSVSPTLRKTGEGALRVNLLDGLTRQALAHTPKGNTLTTKLKPYQVVVGRLQGS